MDHTWDTQIFEAAKLEASASGRPYRTEHHMMLGHRVVYLTDAEIAEAQARTLQLAPAECAVAVNAAFEAAAARLTASYPPSERITWPIQESEALAWSANNAAPTPYIDALAAARGIPRGTYLARTLLKVQGFRAASAAMVGARQKAMDAILVAQDLEGLRAARDAALATLAALP